MDGATMSLSNAQYEAEYRLNGAPAKGNFDSRYGLCFRTCLLYLTNEALRRTSRKKPNQLHIVVEDGQPSNSPTFFLNLMA